MQQKFGFLLEAQELGFPPHGGPRAQREGRTRRSHHRLHGQGIEPTRRDRSPRKLAETIIVKDVRSPERLARRDDPVPAPRGGESPGGQAPHPAEVHRADPGAGGQEGADRRRRHAQHLRPDQRSRALRDGGLYAENGREAIETLRSTRTSTSCSWTS